MRVGVVGAGIAGLVSTKVLRSVGHDVLTFDRVPDVGGVWSATRRYPGLRTQNTRHTYAYSDHPSDDGWPTFPSAEQWQSYLTSYVARFGFGDCLRLGSDVEVATPTGSGWRLAVEGGDVVDVDHLVVANGVFSAPRIPRWPGADAHRTAGGVVSAPSQGLTHDDARDRAVVVVGYGKSACDVAVALSRTARSVTVVARRLLWKGSMRALGRDYEDVVLSRGMEAAFAHPRLARPLFDLARRDAIRGQSLDELGLVPHGRFEEIAQSSISLVTEGFADAVRAGRIVVRRDATIAELTGAPGAVLDDGTTLAAEVVVAATGFEQEVPFLDATVQADDGDFELFRHVLPLEVPRLTFCGYSSSIISALNAEVAAVWTAAHLAGALSLPSVAERRDEVARDLREMSARTRGNHAHGTSVVPFSVRNIDRMLGDLQAPLPLRTRAAQWTRAAHPSDYRDLLRGILRDLR